ncbi:MAG: ABC-type dipeptide/oligopeptide/nickel transport system, permease component [Candidatus Methanohalarchaeum thermophilum]|uniref:ABC-type dipeptide/oligopeptide/nickel transport system, permease component n=1 Tax=Methanohalarchaeum thermophilum TaxID=1903181 RepID=A0A1Q6DT63_METT1|nr:MAG: ABC-type dipeptide/oligopeptide/nickel transport system, permease component [Candidatus Methanohalarchaeum thermophilum]
MLKSLKQIRDEINTVSGYKIIIGTSIVLFFLFIAFAAPHLTQWDPEKQGVGPRLEKPSGEHKLGTTYMGYDLFSRTLFGTRTALSVVLIATALAMAIGIPLGLISGYIGGYSDRLMVLITDALYSFPGILLALLVAAILGGGIINAALAVSVVYIPQYFRVIRNHVMSVKEELYVKGAEAIGSPKRDTIIKYILPNVSQSIPVILTLNAADGVLTLAGLSFLGFGITPPTPSWGYDLKTASSYLGLAESYPEVWYWSLVPGLAIVVLILGFTLLGEGLNDILNPKLREGRRR